MCRGRRLSILALGAVWTLALGAGSSEAQAPPAMAPAPEAVLTSAATVLTAAPASGEAPPARATEEAKATGAEDLATRYGRGIDAYLNGRYEEAAECLSRVWAIDKAPRTAGSLGRAELKLGRYRDAAEHLDHFLRNQVKIAPATRAEVTQMLATAKTKIGTLHIGAEHGGAEVFLDGRRIGATPILEDVYVDPGRHVLRGRLGSLESTRQIDVAAGAARTVWLNLDPPISPRPFPVLPAVGLALSTAALAGGGVLLFHAMDDDARLPSLTPHIAGQPACMTGAASDRGFETQCDALRSIRDRTKVLHDVGLGLLIGGGLGAVLATSLLAVDLSKRPRSVGSRVAPMVGPSGAGLVIQGSF